MKENLFFHSEDMLSSSQDRVKANASNGMTYWNIYNIHLANELSCQSSTRGTGEGEGRC